MLSFGTAVNGNFIFNVIRNGSLSVDISKIAIAISQSVQMQKVVINTLVYLVYGYYNSSTIKDRDRAFLVILVVCCLLVLR